MSRSDSHYQMPLFFFSPFFFTLPCFVLALAQRESSKSKKKVAKRLTTLPFRSVLLTRRGKNYPKLTCCQSGTVNVNQAHTLPGRHRMGDRSWLG
ncbi:hypothetical protein LZ32DRAFT_80340 [Colletotrichum eremochloae]|nr:hypothetical protein LZ32DRAFT_80340 [Colletotrichum eremochloae]